MSSITADGAGSFGEPVATPLRGIALVVAGIAIAIGNFLVVLDTTIANVSVPTIAGSLGVSSSQGAWVITSYAVAEAITVPLTGWLSKKFGAQRVFVTCYLTFGVLSLLCGMANSLGILLLGRVLLGLAGGTLMPLSQMLLLRIFPKEQATTASVIWAMTTLVAPVVGPILGGVISDTIGWPWIFYIKVPLALGGGALAWFMTRGQPDPKEPAKIDGVGLTLLIIWVAALQIMLDEGRNNDWFNSLEICVLAAVAAIGFIAFLIWELTDANPIVDLRVFRHRGFAAAAITYAAGYGAFFGSVFLLPLWLQSNMGYTSTWAGYATGIMGIFAVTCSPLVGKAVEKIDARLIISLGLVGLGLIHVWRMAFSSDVSFGVMALPTLFSGVVMVMFFVPVTGLAMASVEHHEAANAAGLSNFMRTLAGAFATALVQTGWYNAIRKNQTELANGMTHGHAAMEGMVAAGVDPEQARQGVNMLVESQSTMLATLNVFSVIALIFFFSATLIWIAPRPKGPIDTTAAH